MAAARTILQEEQKVRSSRCMSSGLDQLSHTISSSTKCPETQERTKFWICLKVRRGNVLKPAPRCLIENFTRHGGGWSTSINCLPFPPESPAKALNTTLEAAKAHYMKPRKSPLSSTFLYYGEDDNISFLPRKRRRLQRGLKERMLSPIVFEKEPSESSATVQTDNAGRNLPPVRTLEPAIPAVEPELEEKKPSEVGITPSSPGSAFTIVPEQSSGIATVLAKRGKFPGNEYVEDMLASSKASRKASKVAKKPPKDGSYAIDDQSLERKAAAIVNSKPPARKYPFMMRPSGHAKQISSKPRTHLVQPFSVYNYLQL